MSGAEKEFKNLGYTFNETAMDNAHIREIVRKANKVVGCVWGTGERCTGRKSGDGSNKKR
jgi:hypothetical protein